jgi:hypothetical protein
LVELSREYSEAEFVTTQVRNSKAFGVVDIPVLCSAEERFIAQKASDGKQYFDCASRPEIEKADLRGRIRRRDTLLRMTTGLAVS